MRRALCVTAALTLLGLASSFCPQAWAVAPRRVLVIRGSSSPTPTELVEALRIQLGQSAEVVSVAPPDSATGTSRAADAARQQRAASAVIVLWIDDAAEPPRVYALTASVPSTPLELGALSPASAERERVLALKVGELLERELDGSRDSPLAPAARRSRTRAFVEAGVRVWRGGSPVQLVAGSAVSVGPRWEWSNAALEAHGSFVFDGELHAHAPAGQVDVDTTFVGLGGRALWLAPRFAIGPYLEAGVDVLRAHGKTADRRVGAAELRVPNAALGCDLRLRLAPNIELRASAGPKFSFVRERVALEGQRVLDLGWVHPSGALSALLIFP